MNFDKLDKNFKDHVSDTIVLVDQTFSNIYKGENYKELFDNYCNELSSLALENARTKDVTAIVQMESLLLGLNNNLIQGSTSLNAERDRANIEKQATNMNVVNTVLSEFGTYETYKPILRSISPVLSSEFKSGLPHDGVLKCLNSNISSLKNINIGNLAPDSYREFISTRLAVLDVAKDLYRLKLFKFMDQYAKEYPDDEKTKSFLSHRSSLVESFNKKYRKEPEYHSEITETKPSVQNSKETSEPQKQNTQKSDLER